MTTGRRTARRVSIACSQPSIAVNLLLVILTTVNANVRRAGVVSIASHLVSPDEHERDLDGTDSFSECDSLADGEHRRMWQDGEECPCKDGWGGINCNVCETDKACANFPLPGGNSSSLPSGDDELEMTCYKGGDVVFQNHQMCDVTSMFTPFLYQPVEIQVSFRSWNYCSSPGPTTPSHFQLRHG